MMIKFENPSNGRYYYLSTARDLFGQLVLTIIRGGKNSRFVKHFGYDCEKTITKAIEKISRVRLQHGYVSVM